MGLFDKVKTNISSFDWNGTIGKESRTNQDNLPSEPGLPNENQETKIEGYQYGNASLKESSGDRDNQDNLPANQTGNKSLEDRLDEVDLQYKKFGGNEGLKSEGLGFDEPFITKEVGEGYGDILKIPGIFYGSTALSVVRAGEDVVRLGKFALTPKGVLWGVKQALLQKQNSQINTQKFNPVKGLASIAPMVHTPRHANNSLNPFAESEGFEDTDEGKRSQTIQATDVSTQKAGDPDGLFEGLASAFGFGGGGPEIENASTYGFEGSTAKIKSNGGQLYEVGTSNTLQVPYGGKYGDYTQVAHRGKMTSKEEDKHKDFIKFQIRDAVNGKWLIFPAHLGSVTDTITPEYTQDRYIGRPDAVHIYSGTNRSVSFDFKVAAFTKQEIPIIQEKMNYLVGLGYPSYKSYFSGDSEMRPVTPYVYLTLGDMFNKTPGYFNSITITVEENATWEIDDEHQIPQVFSVSCEFVYIGKYLPQTIGKHYEVPWLTDSGVGEKKFGTFGDKDPTTLGNIPDNVQNNAWNKKDGINNEPI